jgi:formate dehydrogenase major subunit
MELSRRDFIKASGAGMSGLVLLGAMGPKGRTPRAIPLKKEIIGETPTICCYCSVGCGAVIAADKAKNLVVNLEGDPDHPISLGSLCSKGQAMFQVHNVGTEINPRRLTTPLYRAAGKSDFQEISWDQAISMVADKVKATRDSTMLVTDDQGRAVNRCETIGSVGGGELDNEECYLLSKANRALGVVYLEHCARI